MTTGSEMVGELMREINNTSNTNNINYQGIQVRKDIPQALQSVEVKETTDLSKMPSEVIGRSQVAKSAIENDIEIWMNNPEKIEELDRYFDYLMDKEEYSYEQACALQAMAGEEFYDL